MRRDDRDDPFDDIFREIERLLEQMTGQETSFGLDPDVDEPGAHVDVHESESEVRVVADLPGADQDDIELRCDGEVLTIGVDALESRIQERITLPSPVDEHSADATFNNGVLEVVFEREDDSASISL